MEIINNADERFKDKQDAVVGCLLELLGLLNELERSVYRRDCVLQDKIPELSAAEISSCSDKLWADYHEECRKILESRCTEKLLKRGFKRSFSNPPMYGYIENADGCRGTFSMDTAKKAVVEFRFTRNSSVHFMHKFALVPSGDTWLVDVFNYGTEKEGVWHRGQQI